jgi:branched-chain amino acid transport system permease protein
LQTSLSGYTSAWLLYLGLFFIVVILYAPAGLAGLMLMHQRVIGTRALRTLLGAYAVALVPATIMAAGAIVLIEMSYRLATQPELGTRMRILWTAVDAGSPGPWIVAVLMLAAGFAAFRATWPLVARAWSRANAEAGTR